jgi:hypothetical protein
VFDAEGLAGVHASGVEAVEQIVDSFEQKGITFVVFDTTGLTPRIGDDHFFPTVADAVECARITAVGLRRPHATMRTMSKLKELTLETRTNKSMRREAYSMSLYVSIILLSALSVFDDSHPPGRGEVLLLEAGTTIGLVLAHGFASWVSTRIIGEASEEVDPGDLLLVQLGGAVAVATLAMLAVLVTPTSIELMAARFTVAGTIGALVFLESRATNSARRAAVYGLLALIAGVSVAAVKSILAH